MFLKAHYVEDLIHRRYRDEKVVYLHGYMYF